MIKNLYLLINLGTPKAPTPFAISQFLKQFLNDPLVITLPFIPRWLLVHLFIVPRRCAKTARAYKSIWTHQGSPLKVHTENLALALQQYVDSETKVRWAMRYSEPSIEEALTDLPSHYEIQVLPLYPQYALSSTQSVINKLKSVANQRKIKNKIRYLPHFYQYNEFISAYVDVFQKYAPSQWDHVLFSFHGLPISHLPSFCSLKPNCCDLVEARSFCYRAQAYHCAHRIAKYLNLSKNHYSVAFQSRLGKEEWIRPYTDIWLEQLAHQGIKNLVVLCPSFVSDCLETLEEIKIREQQRFQKKGGKAFTLIPCLNSEAFWVQAVSRLFTHYDKDWIPLFK